MKNKVCIVTGSRAEFGLLKPLINRLDNDKDIKLLLVVTGSHLLKEYGSTIREIEKSNISITKKILISLKDNTKEGVAKTTGKTIAAFTDFFSKNKPDLLIVLGDRFEIFAASTSAAILGIPIAHIHGGEITEGAIDEFFRHSITKMSYLHFASCEEYKKRIIQLGESPDRVYNVGALCVENIKRKSTTTSEEIEKEFKVNLQKPYAIVTLHPETHSNISIKKQMNEVLFAMKNMNKINYIITKSNADAYGMKINNIWKDEIKKHSNWYLVSSFGADNYLTVLRNAEFVLGNSSSGMIEAPVLKVPSINIGNRQKGRYKFSSIIFCEFDRKDIIKSINKSMSIQFINSIKNEKIYGHGNTSLKIIEIIKNFLNNYPNTLEKVFYDIK